MSTTAGDPTGPAAASAIDLEHLRLLAIFHYVVAALAAFWGCFPILHVAMGLMMMFLPESAGTPGEPPPRLFGALFAGLGGLFMLTAWGLAACLVVAGRSLRQRVRYVFCLVTAGVTAAICMPLGTILGICTMIVLLRPSVKQAFATGGPAPAA